MLSSLVALSAWLIYLAWTLGSGTWTLRGVDFEQILGHPAEWILWVVLGALLALHTPATADLGKQGVRGAPLALGTAIMVPAADRLGVIPAGVLAVATLVSAAAWREIIQPAVISSRQRLEAMSRGFTEALGHMAPILAGSLLALVGHTLWIPGWQDARWPPPEWMSLELLGPAMLYLVGRLGLGFMERWGSDEPLIGPWIRPLPLALETVGWILGALASQVARQLDWWSILPFFFALALLSAESARNALLRGASDQRVGSLERIQEAHVRMIGETSGMGGIAQQFLVECSNVLPVQWFQLALTEAAIDPGPAGAQAARSWAAGPDGVLIEGEPIPPKRPAALPGLHRRADWLILEHSLVFEGEDLAVVRLWCDPRQVEPGSEALLASLVPQMASSIHRARLDREAKLDPLTGVAVRRILEQRLQRAYQTSCDDGHSMAVILCDIDFFKKVNDTYGHDAGDQALIHFARTLDTHKREGDLCCRYGGEEFTLLLEETDGNDALALAERLRQAVEELYFEYEGQHIPLTMSSGVASFPELYVKTGGQLQLLADEALYEAKKNGRNRCLLNLGRGFFGAPDGQRIARPDATELDGPPRLFM